MDSTPSASHARAEEIAHGLFPHQVEGLAFLLGRRRSILADDMGLGKTRQSIYGLTQATAQGPYLIVCPASVKRNWVREILTVLPDADTHVTGPGPLPEPGFSGWVIINYDILKKHAEDLLQRSWSGLVFDEAHYLKNHRSIRSRVATRLVSESPGTPVVHALTGTPLTNRPRDLFPLLQLVDHSLGKSFLGFAKRYCDGHKDEYGHWITKGSSNIDELAVQLHGIMLRRTKDEVLDLPPKIRTWIDVDVPQPVVDRLNELVRLYMEPDADHTPSGIRRGIGMFSSARRQLAVAKAKYTLEYVQGAVDQGEKVLLFTGFSNPIKRFARHFGEQAVVISGKVPMSKRQDLVDRFQEDESVRVYIGHIHAGGIGVNLTAARQVIFNDLDWVPATHWQAEDRAHRIGQSGTVNVTYMVARGTLEEFIRTVLETKTRLVDDVVAGKALGPDMDADMLSELRRMLDLLSGKLDSVDRNNMSHDEVMDVLREAGRAYIEEQAPAIDRTTGGHLIPVSDAAIRALASVLTGPERSVYRVASSSDQSVRYNLEVVGADITCECKGFTYRGACAHVRTLKDALVSGGQLPDTFEKVE